MCRGWWSVVGCGGNRRARLAFRPGHIGRGWRVRSRDTWLLNARVVTRHPCPATCRSRIDCCLGRQGRPVGPDATVRLTWFWRGSSASNPGAPVARPTPGTVGTYLSSIFVWTDVLVPSVCAPEPFVWLRKLMARSERVSVTCSCSCPCSTDAGDG